ncbi:Histone acetyltransferase HPA2/related acetyltransferase [Hahella chejuensis KCTC 2396]|uniref:Histone acetyltransferase HPA2/related acetyltransferase n=1 Tax=Hahella chejuensis (strain KCTC 2396) TaxID=349521 RepID=Q2SJM2_HAHCH|nr:GNAT family N-acetyltransferase [Hahella chejuensis]ABC29152.1 Histone acetyltransferase HPA2/related acetyltransferase [Hahella chejuensis KCTC 2396]
MTTLKYTRITTWLENESELRAIRQQVFVEEQGVPPELEWDNKDENAVHFLVKDVEDRNLAVARLVRLSPEKAKFGRLAVLPEFRRQGIARSLLKFVIGYARSEGFNHLTLSANIDATSLYANEGFQALGSPHEEAGSLHQRMELTLGTAKVEAATALGQDERVYRIHAEPDYLEHLKSLTSQAKQSALILTWDLEKNVLDNPDVLDALSRLARSGRATQIKILLGAPKTPVAQSNQLLALARRLTSNIEIKMLNPELSFPEQVYVLIDDDGVLLRHHYEKWEGFCCYQDPGTVKRLKDEFMRLLQHSQVSQELRQFSL